MNTLIFLIVAIAAASAPSNKPRTLNYNDRFSVLSDHNIFLKDRTQRPAPQAPTTQKPSDHVPEQDLVLHGIVFEDNAYHAYIEDPAGRVTRLSTGDSISRGKVVEIQIDAICYEHNGAKTWVNVGADLTGRDTSAALELATTGPASTQPAALGFDPNDPNLTTEQKMRLRSAVEHHR